LGARAFTYFDTAGSDWRADAGGYTVSVGESSAAIALHGSLRLDQAFTQPK